MIPTEIIKKIEALLTILSANVHHVIIDNNRIVITGDKERIKGELTSLNIEIDQLDDYLLFNNFVLSKIFLQQELQYKLDAKETIANFAVLDLCGSAVLYYEKEIYVINSNHTLLQEVENALAYFTLYNYFKTLDFSDHHNDAQKEIIIYNSAKGILKIKYQSQYPSFTELIKNNVNKILIEIRDPQFKNYFKISLFENALGNTISLSEIITKADILLSSAKRDFEIAIKQFDFEKFRDSLYVQKDKFFTSIRDVLSKIFGQVIGIPLSITATVYTSYKADHATFVSSLILISFIVYVIIYLAIQWSYLKDIDIIYSDFLRDFEIIKLKSGLPESVIKDEESKIEKKIDSTENISIILMTSVMILGSTVALFLLDQIIK